MKKIHFVHCFVALTCAICTYAEMAVNIDLLDFKFYPYPGSRDGIRDYYEAVVPKTSLGVLANYADVIAIGTVITQDWQNMTVRVDHALAGCTNAQNVVIRKHFGVEHVELNEGLFPTNASKIVFSALAHENIIPLKYDMSDIVSVPSSTTTNAPFYWLQYDTRQWWHLDRDDGLLLQQFTNVLQAVRHDQNWENYYHLCRDGLLSPSDRVKEDSFNDLWCLLLNTSDQQAKTIVSEAWMWPELKDVLRHKRRPHFNEL